MSPATACGAYGRLARGGGVLSRGGTGGGNVDRGDVDADGSLVAAP